MASAAATRTVPTRPQSAARTSRRRRDPTQRTFRIGVPAGRPQRRPNGNSYCAKFAAERRVPAACTFQCSMDDHQAMGIALDEARLAPAHDDVPVGAVALRSGAVIARAHNERERRGDPTAHAELLALQAAALVVGGGGSATSPSWSRSSRAPCVPERWSPRGSADWSSGPWISRRGRAARCTTCVPTPGSTTNCPLSGESGPASRPRCSKGSSPTAAGLPSSIDDGWQPRRGARAAESDGLENRCGGNLTVGSNPTPSANRPGLSQERTGLKNLPKTVTNVFLNGSWGN